MIDLTKTFKYTLIAVTAAFAFWLLDLCIRLIMGASGPVMGYSQSRPRLGSELASVSPKTAGLPLPAEETRGAPVSPMPAPALPVERHGEALDYFWLRESTCGKDPRAARGIIGPAGERGQYQICPIFVADVYRIAGNRIDVYDNASCRKGIAIWLSHYAPRVGAESIEELYELYRRGPTGYGQWKGQ